MELMLVAAVIGLGTVMVSASFDSFVPKERLNTAIRELTALLRETRSHAISRSLEFFIEYDLTEERYRRVTPFVLGGGRFDVENDEDEERVAGGSPHRTASRSIRFPSPVRCTPRVLSSCASIPAAPHRTIRSS
jgi:hypothetical protein